ncbi:alpha/beta fold hydrolase [Halovenus halobia]|uniref:alpha/beta fold hydrolase n=1 Tax=Halovenus halobia TaxID=3396622 RepID=UPI003F54D83E
METVTAADGTTIAYDRFGEGRPLVCLHGTGVRRTMWALLGQQLSEFSLLAPDRRGRGDSTDTDPYHFEREIEDVQALAAACEEDPILVGSSFGGLLAMAAADAVDPAGLALYEPPLPRATLEEASERSLATETAAHIDAGDPEAAARTFFTEATGAESVEHWPIWPECVEFAHTIPRECRTVENFEIADAPTEFETLLLTGTESPQYLQDGIDQLATRIPDHTLATLAGVGHAGVATAPDQVADALESTFA